MILRMDGIGHKLILKGIEMFGKYVIPEFRSPALVERERAYEAFDVEQHPYTL